MEEGKCVIQKKSILKGEVIVQEIKDAIKELNRLAPHQQDLLNFDGDIARTLAAGTHGAAKHLTKTIVRNKDMSNGQEYIVRRLTPLECNRLQGFPDGWGEIDYKDDLTDEEYAFWLDVRNTYAEINGKQVKDYTKEQMLKWYNKLHTDSAEYKMWGNGIALPNALYVMEGIISQEE